MLRPGVRVEVAGGLGRAVGEAELAAVRLSSPPAALALPKLLALGGTRGGAVGRGEREGLRCHDRLPARRCRARRAPSSDSRSRSPRRLDRRQAIHPVIDLSSAAAVAGEVGELAGALTSALTSRPEGQGARRYRAAWCAPTGSPPAIRGRRSSGPPSCSPIRSARSPTTTLPSSPRRVPGRDWRASWPCSAGASGLPAGSCERLRDAGEPLGSYRLVRGCPRQGGAPCLERGRAQAPPRRPARPRAGGGGRKGARARGAIGAAWRSTCPPAAPSAPPGRPSTPRGPGSARSSCFDPGPVALLARSVAARVHLDGRAGDAHQPLADRAAEAQVRRHRGGAARHRLGRNRSARRAWLGFPGMPSNALAGQALDALGGSSRATGGARRLGARRTGRSLCILRPCPTLS